MRTFHWNAPIIGAGALALSVLLPAPPLKAEETGANVTATATEPAPQGLRELKSTLDHSDRRVALQALHMALNELGDGTTLVWRRPASQVVGRVSPVSAFRDDQGRVCRHVVYSLAIGFYQRTIEGDACREQDGRWSIAG